MYKHEFFCPICGFITELEFEDKECYDDFNYENCTFCNDGFYQKLIGTIFFNDESGYYECK